MMQRSKRLRVNEVEEQEDYKSAVAEILRNIQHDHGLTLQEISEQLSCSLGTISNAANKKGALNPVYLKRIGQAYGSHTLDPYAKLAGGRMIPLDADEAGDVLPLITIVSHRIATARSPNSPGGAAETLGEQLGYLPDLRRLQRELSALICKVEARRDA